MWNDLGVMRLLVALLAVAVMALLALRHAWRSSTLRDLALAAALLLALGLAFWWLTPTFKGLGYGNILIFLVIVVALCLAAGVPIAFCFGMGTLCFLVFSTNVPMLVMVGRMDEGMSSIILLSVPIFVLLGCILDATGMGKAIVDFLASMLGHIRAGMSYVRGTVHTEEGDLIASFTQDALIRPLRTTDTAIKEQSRL